MTSSKIWGELLDHYWGERRWWPFHFWSPSWMTSFPLPVTSVGRPMEMRSSKMAAESRRTVIFLLNSIQKTLPIPLFSYGVSLIPAPRCYLQQQCIVIHIFGDVKKMLQIDCTIILHLSIVAKKNILLQRQHNYGVWNYSYQKLLYCICYTSWIH